MAVRKRKELPDQPWVAEFVDPDTGKRRQVKPATGLKKDAQKIYDDAMRRREEKRLNPHSTKITVGRASDIYLAHVEERAKLGEIGKLHAMHLRQYVSGHILPLLGEQNLDEVTGADVQACFSAMLRKGLHPASAKKRIRTLRHIEEFARKQHWTDKRTISDACLDIRANGYKAVRRFTIDEIKHIIVSAESRAPHARLRNYLVLRCAIHLAAFCSLRIGEIRGLTLDDINLPARLIHVRHNLTRLDELKDTKTDNGLRDVPVPEHLVTMLREWMTTYYLENERRLVFTTDDARSVNYCHFRNHSWVPLLCRIGLAKQNDAKFPHFHALRHFYTAIMLKTGVSVTDVAALMGHSSPAITMKHYAHALRDENQHHGVIDGIATKLLPAPVAPPDPVTTNLRLSRLTHWH